MQIPRTDRPLRELCFRAAGRRGSEAVVAALRPSGRGAWMLVALVAALVAGCGEEPVEESPSEPPVLSVKAFQLGGAGLGETHEYPGELAAWQNSEMAFEVSGKIIDWRFTEGQQVKKGTILARLDPRDFEAGVKAAEANMARAKADYIRYTKLYEEGVAAESEFDARKRRYEVRQAELQIAKKSLEDADLVAPFDGVVARKLVQDFENVVDKIPVLVLQDLSRFKIKVTVPERDMTGDRESGGELDIEEINRLLRPEVVLSTLRGRRFDAELYELALTADPVTRTFEATFVMERPGDVGVFPGMTAKVIIHVRPRSGMGGLTVPGVAVWADDEGETHVWVIDQDSMTVSAVPVEVGGLTGDRIAIEAGLEGGETLATSGIQLLTSGQRVRPLDARMR